MLTTPHFLQAQPLGAICRRLSAASELNLCASVMLGSAFDADWMRVNAARAAANVAFSFVSCFSCYRASHTAPAPISSNPTRLPACSLPALRPPSRGHEPAASREPPRSKSTRTRTRERQSRAPERMWLHQAAPAGCTRCTRCTNQRLISNDSARTPSAPTHPSPTARRNHKQRAHEARAKAHKTPAGRGHTILTACNGCHAAPPATKT